MELRNMPTPEEVLNTAILTRLSYFSLNAMVTLYRELGSATAIMERRHELGRLFPGLPHKVTEALADTTAMRRRAAEELDYDARHGIQVLCLNDEAYPWRLKECPDAPLMLFYKGTADLNRRHIINIVGTRHCTPYGADLVRHFVAARPWPAAWRRWPCWPTASTPSTHRLTATRPTRWCAGADCSPSS